jgi:small subunit ribosomal protein S1
MKSEGLIPLEQVMDSHRHSRSCTPATAVDVVIEREEPEGGYLLGYEKAQRLRVWDTVEKAHNEKTPLTGTVVGRVKGGLTVDIGIKAFLPGSQLELRPVRNLDAYIGQPIQVRVIKLNKKRGNVVVSRKEILEEEQTERRSHTLEHLEEGAILTGTVKNLTDYGAFVDLGGIDGLLHITDMSWGRLTHPRDLVNVGDEIQVKVLKFDKEKQRVSLGFKQLTPDPWLDAAERYPIGARVHGRVLSVTDYGAFVELEQGIEGLVHRLGDDLVEAHEASLQAGQARRRGRDRHSCRQSRRPPHLARHEAASRESLGASGRQVSDRATVEGRVRNLTDFGAFIEIEDGIDGLVHVSNLSWTKRVKHPSEVLKKGEKVRAVVLGVEPRTAGSRLGIKQLQPDVWETFFAQHRVGDMVKGKVLQDRAVRRLRRNRRGSRGPLPRLRSDRRTWRSGQAGAGPGARLQNHPHEPGREEGCSQHPRGQRRGSQPRQRRHKADTSSPSPAPPPPWAIWSTGRRPGPARAHRLRPGAA